MAGSNADVKALAISDLALDEDGNMQFLPGSVPGLTEEQSDEAYGTKVHSLRLMETIILSGHMRVTDIMKALETLAKYQFKPASARKDASPDDSAIDVLRELIDGDTE